MAWIRMMGEDKGWLSTAHYADFVHRIGLGLDVGCSEGEVRGCKV